LSKRGKDFFGRASLFEKADRAGICVELHTQTAVGILNELPGTGH
jgi:hypothetical protein